MTRAAVVLLLCLIVPAMVSGQNPQKILPWGSTEHLALRRLAIEAGVALPSGTGPFSVAELNKELDRIDPASLSPSALQRYHWLRDRLDPAGTDTDLLETASSASNNNDGGLALHGGLPPHGHRPLHSARALDGGLALNAGLQTTVGGRFSQIDIPAATDRSGIRDPFINVPVEGWAGDSAYGYTAVDLRRLPLQYPGHPDAQTANGNPWTNLPIPDVGSIDIQFPHRAFLSFGNNWWNVQFGRDRLNWGNGLTGNTYISDAADFHEYIRLTAFWQRFKFSTVWMNMEGRLYGDPEGLYVDGDGRSEMERLVAARGDHVDFSYQKHFLAHRFELRLFNRLNLIATEGIVYGGRDLELRYLNPLMIYHNQYVNPFPGNVHMSFELEFTPVPGFVAYAQISPDQWSTPAETGSYTVNEPDALGYIAGINHVRPLGAGVLTSAFEAALMDPWMYLHQLAYTTLSLRQLYRAEYYIDSDTADHTPFVDVPLGYFTGPDAAVVYLSSRYEEDNRLAAGFEGWAIVQGENTLFDRLPMQADQDLSEAESRATTPTGDHPQWTFVATLAAQLQPGLLNPLLGVDPDRPWQPSFSARASMTWATVVNRDNLQAPAEHGVQLALSVTAAWD